MQEFHFHSISSPVTGLKPLSGGSINEVWLLETDNRQYVAKVYAAENKAMMEAEIKGLEMLRNTKTLVVPHTIEQVEENGKGALLMEYIKPGKVNSHSWRDFGRKLALLHDHSAKDFGLDHDNFIGSLPQQNKKHPSAASFFIEERLRPQLNLARASGKIDFSLQNDFQTIYSIIAERLSEDKPAFVHGDLWSGNFIWNDKGEACLIDPAVHYGIREADLGMTLLFGGFHPHFYQGYLEQTTLSPQWQEKAELLNLYPLLVHINLFGGSYVEQLKTLVQRLLR